MLNQSTVSGNDESKLWSGILDGNEHDLASLFSMYYQQLFTYGYKIVSREDYIKDCIQELFLNIWEKRKTLSQAKSVKSYLLISLRRTIFQNLRMYRNQQKRNNKYIEETKCMPVNAEDILIDIEHQIENQKLLDEAINGLSNKKKKVIYLKYYDGLSNSEIANLMSIKRQSVYNHVSEAINEMQAFIK